jgi:hypothetical protein
LLPGDEVVRRTYSASVPVAGSSGVQFGAFEGESAARLQQGKVYALFGLATYLEKYNGMLRVRAKMSESEALKTKERCASSGVDCFLFH